MSKVLLTVTVIDKPIEEIITCEHCGATLEPHPSFINALCCPKCPNWYTQKKIMPEEKKGNEYENSTKSK